MPRRPFPFFRSFLTVICYLTMSGVPLHAADLPTEQRDALIVKLTARLKILANSTITYTNTQNYTPPDGAGANLAPNHVLRKGPRTRTCTLTLANGTIRLESNATPQDAAREADVQTEITLASADRVELLRMDPPANFRIGTISAEIRAPKDEHLDIALGLRPLTDRLLWLDAAQMKSWQWSTRPDGQIEATWADPDGYHDLCRFDPHQDNALVFYQGGDTPNHPLVELYMSDFKAAGTLKVPTKVERFAYYYLADGIQRTSCTCTMLVDKYVLKAPSPLAANPLMVWPKGTDVFDERTRQTFPVRSSDRTISDEFIRSRLLPNPKPGLP